MTEIDFYEAKDRLAELIKLVAKGEVVVITNRGIPVAELLPPQSSSRQDLTALISSIQANRVGKIDRQLFQELESDGLAD